MAFADLLATMDRAIVDVLDDGAISYVPQAGQYAGVEAQPHGIFDAAYQFFDYGESGVATSAPALFVLYADLPGADDATRDFTQDQARITIGSKVYTVREARPDGKGTVVFMLREAVY